MDTIERIAVTSVYEIGIDENDISVSGGTPCPMGYELLFEETDIDNTPIRGLYKRICDEYTDEDDPEYMLLDYEHMVK